ncbi:glycosyltransferase, partial [Cylindrospermopsis raciborskii]|uniref:glycosyltransferase n=1 Tax=Cylindrospermopsis raciborskii TaxID=77022 RepID=UPI0038D215DC
SPLRIFLTILGNEFIIMVNQNILILRPKFNIFWAIFIKIFLTFNTSASGVTFIASDCPVGPREISEVLECGCLVPPNDVDTLSKAIINHVETPKEIIDRSEKIERLFSESSCANKLELLIHKILQKKT